MSVFPDDIILTRFAGINPDFLLARTPLRMYVYIPKHACMHTRGRQIQTTITTLFIALGVLY